MQITYKTGRTYDGPQVIEITAPDLTDDADLYADVVVEFRDESRGITGRVTLFGALTIDAHDLGRAVLAAYDAGAYRLE